MAEMLHVTEDTFKIEVLDSSQPVLVDFSAVWCQPCKMLDPIVKQLAGEWDGKVKVVKIDADENPNLVMQFGVMGIPTLLFFKGGEIKERITGFLPKEKLVARFSPHFQLRLCLTTRTPGTRERFVTRCPLCLIIFSLIYRVLQNPHGRSNPD